MTRTLKRGVLSWKPVKNLFFSLMSSLLLLVLFLEKCAELWGHQVEPIQLVP